jgi:hypothetical protein
MRMDDLGLTAGDMLSTIRAVFGPKLAVQTSEGNG